MRLTNGPCLRFSVSNLLDLTYSQSTAYIYCLDAEDGKGNAMMSKTIRFENGEPTERFRLYVLVFISIPFPKTFTLRSGSRQLTIIQPLYWRPTNESKRNRWPRKYVQNNRQLSRWQEQSQITRNPNCNRKDCFVPLSESKNHENGLPIGS